MLPGLAPVAPTAEGESTPGLREALGSFEREKVLQALKAAGGNQTRAAQLLGVARRTLINKLEMYGIARPRKKGG